MCKYFMKYLAVSGKMRTFASDYKANLRIMRIVPEKVLEPLTAL
jgi:hypothetical protein